MNLESNIEKLEERIAKNADKIEDNSQRIQRNTGALEILHTINNCKRRYFTMWLITFIAFLGSICYIIYLLSRW